MQLRHVIFLLVHLIESGTVLNVSKKWIGRSLKVGVNASVIVSSPDDLICRKGLSETQTQNVGMRSVSEHDERRNRKRCQM